MDNETGRFDFAKYQTKGTKSKYVALHFTPDHWQKIEKYSQKEGIKKSQFARELLSYALLAYESGQKSEGRRNRK